MFYALLDTCSWFEVGVTRNADLILSKIEEFVNDRRLTLLVPGQVTEEFARHRDEMAQRIGRRESNQIFGAIEYIERNSHLQSSQEALEILNEAMNQLDADISTATNSLNRIEALFAHETSHRIERNATIDTRVVNRGLLKKAPFAVAKNSGKQQRNKNSVADAMIIEMFAECVEQRPSLAQRYIFSTFNTRDFSDANDTSLPHPDISDVFERENVDFIPNYADAFNLIAATSIPEPVVHEVGTVIDVYNRRPKCPVCHSRSLIPAGATGQGHRGETIYYFICRDCGQMTDVRIAWAQDQEI